jgi:hypothetical protein
MAEQPPPGKRKGGLKTWHLIVGAVGVVGVYYLYEKRKAASAVPAATATPVGSGSSAGTAASSYGNAGDLASLLPYLQPASAQSSTTGTATGSGVTSAGGSTYTQVPDSEGYSQLLNSGLGSKLYYQVAPGTFSPVTQQVASTGAASGQKLFIGPDWQAGGYSGTGP